jgi:hypothetical protein
MRSAKRLLNKTLRRLSVNWHKKQSLERRLSVKRHSSPLL